jgi:hypothetical protein
MTWHALTAPAVIAAKADLREIDAAMEKLHRGMRGQVARMSVPRGDKASRDSFTYALIRRKIDNLETARRIWLDRFREDDGQ